MTRPGDERDEDPQDGEDRSAGEDREDREAILTRRAALVAAAMAGISAGVGGCDWLDRKLGRGLVSPEVCLTTSMPEPCLQVRSQACLSVERTEPMACLSVALPEPVDAGAPAVQRADGGSARRRPRAQACLSMSAPEPVREVRPMACLSEEMVSGTEGEE